MTAISQTIRNCGTSLNNGFNNTVGKLCIEMCKITHSDDKESPLGVVRSVDGILKSLADLPMVVSELGNLLPENVVKHLPFANFALYPKVKVASKLISELKTTLTFTEVIGRVKKWSEETSNDKLKNISWTRIGNKLFNISQKVIESFVLIPAKWGFYDLGNFCLRVGSWTGRTITPLHFSTAKDLFMVASSACAVYASLNEQAALSAKLGSTGINDANKKDIELKIQGIALGRKFDISKVALGLSTVTLNVVAVSTMGPAGIAAVKVAGYAAGVGASFFGIQRTIFSTWINPAKAA